MPSNLTAVESSKVRDLCNRFEPASQTTTHQGKTLTLRPTQTATALRELVAQTGKPNSLAQYMPTKESLRTLRNFKKQWQTQHRLERTNCQNIATKAQPEPKPTLAPKPLILGSRPSEEISKKISQPSQRPLPPLPIPNANNNANVVNHRRSATQKKKVSFAKTLEVHEIPAWPPQPSKSRVWYKKLISKIARMLTGQRSK